MTATIDELEKLALALPEPQRARLAASILESLPGVLSGDDGVEEALRRDAELDARSATALSPEQLDDMIRNRRG